MIHQQLELHARARDRDADARAEARGAVEIEIALEEIRLTRGERTAPAIADERREVERVVRIIAVAVVAAAAIAPAVVLRKERCRDDAESQNQNQFSHGG